MAQFMYHRIEFVVSIEEKKNKRYDIQMEREFYGKIGWQLKYWDRRGEIDCLLEDDNYELLSLVNNFSYFTWFVMNFWWKKLAYVGSLSGFETLNCFFNTLHLIPLCQKP